MFINGSHRSNQMQVSVLNKHIVQAIVFELDISGVMSCMNDKIIFQRFSSKRIFRRIKFQINTIVKPRIKNSLVGKHVRSPFRSVISYVIVAIIAERLNSTDIYGRKCIFKMDSKCMTSHYPIVGNRA